MIFKGKELAHHIDHVTKSANTPFVALMQFKTLIRDDVDLKAMEEEAMRISARIELIHLEKAA